MRRIIEQFRIDIATLDRRAIFAFLYAGFGLASIYYLKNQAAIAAYLHGTRFEAFGEWIAIANDNNLPALSWWVLVVTIFYFVLPAVAIKFLYREDLSDYGLRLATEPGFWKVLAVCIAVMLPIVVLVSTTAGFSAKYPFFQIYNGDAYLGSRFLLWELIYFFQFFGLEFFFRGFLLHSLKPSLGLYSIFAMTVPYCMIHFGKPPAETLAAIIAGVFLGWLSYRNGSILLGLILHCTVAFSMDILALMHKGLLFK
ncbi:MAG: CPBP family intramembrane glutamic endopeptidase [Pyrinomonadaceae bacterium]